MLPFWHFDYNILQWRTFLDMSAYITISLLYMGVLVFPTVREVFYCYLYWKDFLCYEVFLHSTLGVPNFRYLFIYGFPMVLNAVLKMLSSCTSKNLSSSSDILSFAWSNQGYELYCWFDSLSYLFPWFLSGSSSKALSHCWISHS